MPADVVVAGHVCLDLVPELPAVPSVAAGSLTDVGGMSLRLGGCVGNVARALAELDVPLRLATAVGDDDLAPVLLGLLVRHGLDVTGVPRLRDAGTSYSLVVEAPGLDRAFWHHVGANARFEGSQVDLEGATLLHLGYVTLLPSLYADGGRAGLELLRTARTAGVTTSIDAAVVDPRSAAAAVDWGGLVRQWLPSVDICTPSLDDLVSMRLAGPTGGGSADADALEWARWLVAGGAAVALVTAGSDGMALATGSAQRLADGGRALAPHAPAWAEQALWRPAGDVVVRTTTGAGDAAAAGLLCALLRGEPPGAALELAVSCAAQRVAGADRLDARPTKEEAP